MIPNISPEARVLRELRLKHDLKLREVAEHLGCSPSYVSQFESGKMPPPKGEKFECLLTLYGGINERYFTYRLVKKYREESENQDVILRLLPLLSPTQKKSVRNLVEQIIKLKPNSNTRIGE